MRAGYTSISSGTMHQLVAAIAADAFNVPLRDVRAGINDGQGQVSVQLAVPLAIPALAKEAGQEQAQNRAGTLFERAATARKVVAQRLHHLAGINVGQVDIRFTGVHHGKPSTAGRVT